MAARFSNSVTRDYAAIAQPQLPQRHSCCRQRSQPAAVGRVLPACASTSCGVTGNMSQARRCGRRPLDMGMGSSSCTLHPPLICRLVRRQSVDSPLSCALVKLAEDSSCRLRSSVS